MRFDAYAASIRSTHLSDVAEAVAWSCGGIVTRGRPVRRFGQVLSIDVGPRMAAWAGWDQSSGLIYVEAKGETTPQVSKGLRAHFPEHSVPRVDVCEDFDGPGVFDSLRGVVRRNKGPRVKSGYVALPDDEKDGKTWAAGVRGGVSFVRVYEAGKHPDRVHLNRPDWVRLELEARPHYARDKVAAASMGPLDVWGLSSWTHKVGEAVSNVDIKRFEPEVRKYSHDKTTTYIARTFRRHLEEMIANGEDVVRTFQAVWQEDDSSGGMGGAPMSA